MQTVAEHWCSIFLYDSLFGCLKGGHRETAKQANAAHRRGEQFIDESPSSDDGDIIATREYEIDGITYIVHASQSKTATEDAVTKMRRLIRREISEAIAREKREK